MSRQPSLPVVPAAAAKETNDSRWKEKRSVVPFDRESVRNSRGSTLRDISATSVETVFETGSLYRDKILPDLIASRTMHYRR